MIRTSEASEPREGHNSDTIGAGALRSFLERIERLQEERKTIADDIAEVFNELESEGFDKQAAKIVLKIRASADAIETYTARSHVVDVYLAALGLLGAPAPAHARENITQFPPKTAHDVRPQHSEVSSQEGRGYGEDCESVSHETGMTGESRAPTPVERQDRVLVADPGMSGKVLDPSEVEGPAPIPDTDVPAFLKPKPVLRPHCQEPEMCRSGTSEHCYSCKKLMAELAA